MGNFHWAPASVFTGHCLVSQKLRLPSANRHRRASAVPSESEMVSELSGAPKFDVSIVYGFAISLQTRVGSSEIFKEGWASSIQIGEGNESRPSSKLLLGVAPNAVGQPHRTCVEAAAELSTHRMIGRPGVKTSVIVSPKIDPDNSYSKIFVFCNPLRQFCVRARI